MPVTGLVLTVTDEDSRRAVMESLRLLGYVDIGEVHDLHIPVVVESDGVADEQERVRTIAAMPAVSHAVVVHFDFSDLSDAHMPEAREFARARRPIGSQIPLTDNFVGKPAPSVRRGTS